MTDFEGLIWSLLKEIPRGRVSTYALLAKAAGRPRAARAVGNALNKNPLAPTVPCHRIVKSDGSLGGYAAGSERKIKLLAEEGVEVVAMKVLDFEKRLFKW